MFRRPALLAAGLASALLIGACASDPFDESSPADLAEFHDQEVEFEACAPYATNAADEAIFSSERFDCARVEVPLDYEDPDGERGEVALLRLEATGDKIGTLFVNPGGPGASGMNFAALLQQFWDASEVSERFDIVGWDTRGVGASTPTVECFTDEETDANEPPAPYLFTVGSTEEAEEIAQRCIDGTGEEALTSVGSANVVQDMDVMREVLGDDELNYLGYSYGSELGAMYAEAFPENVRALVIDGAVHPDLSEPAFRQTQFTAMQEAFEGLAALCAQGGDCPLGDDPAQAADELRALIEPLDEDPLPVGDDRVLDTRDALQAIQPSLNSAAGWPPVVEALKSLADGDGAPLLAVRDGNFARGEDGRYGSGLTFDANLAIRCMDNPRTQDEQDELLAHAREATPFMVPGFPDGDSVYECAGWPEPVSRDLPWLTGGDDLPETLTVSVTGDPGTPHDGGIAFAERLGSSLLTVEGVQHGVSLYAGNECIDDVVTDYLVDLETPDEGARCEL